MSAPPQQLQSPSLSVFLSLSPSSRSLHCGSVNCSYSNIPSLPSPQLSYSQPLSRRIINLLVLSTCKSQTVEPYGAIFGRTLIRFRGVTEPPSRSDRLTTAGFMGPGCTVAQEGVQLHSKVSLSQTFTHNSRVRF